MMDKPYIFARLRHKFHLVFKFTAEGSGRTAGNFTCPNECARLSRMNLSPSLLTGLALCASLLYLAGPGLIMRDVLAQQEPRRHRLWVLGSGALAVGFHLLLSLNHLIQFDALTFGFFNMLSLVLLVICGLFLISALNKPIETLSLVIFPVAAVALLLNVFVHSPASHSLLHSGWQIQSHVVLSLLAYSLLSVAAVQALMLSIQEKQLHGRQPGRFIQSMPPLQVMEALMFQMIGSGVVLLSLSLISGVLFLEDLFAQHLVHKTVLSILAWLVFITLLWGRQHYGWRGQTAIKWTFSGYLALMLAYFGSKFVLELILNTP